MKKAKNLTNLNIGKQGGALPKTNMAMKKPKAKKAVKKPKMGKY